jgi:hypothetical protein
VYANKSLRRLQHSRLNLEIYKQLSLSVMSIWCTETWYRIPLCLNWTSLNTHLIEPQLLDTTDHGLQPRTFDGTDSQSCAYETAQII